MNKFRQHLISHHNMTPTQARLVDLLCMNLNAEQIRDTTGLKRSTINKHLWDIRKPLGLKTRGELTAMFIEIKRSMNG